MTQDHATELALSSDEFSWCCLLYMLFYLQLLAILRAWRDFFLKMDNFDGLDVLA